MSALERIAVKVIPARERPTGNAAALLNELLTLLEGWVSDGKCASIDLRSLPLNGADYAELHAALGTGAVGARIEAIGATDVHETRYAGVWWVTHYNEAQEVVAELIEVGDVPDILRTPREDGAAALARLRIARENP